MCNIVLVLFLTASQVFWSLVAWWYKIWLYLQQLKIQPTSLFPLQHTHRKTDLHSVCHGRAPHLHQLWIINFHPRGPALHISWRGGILWVNVSSWHASESTGLSLTPCAGLGRARKHKSCVSSTSSPSYIMHPAQMCIAASVSAAGREQHYMRVHTVLKKYLSEIALLVFF